MKPIIIVMAAGALSTLGTAAAQQTGGSDEAQQRIPATPHQEQVLRETTSDLFKRLDADGDGSISRQEAEAEPALARRWAEYDHNGDQVLSQEEFSEFEESSTSPAESEEQELGQIEGGIPATPHQQQVIRNELVEQLDKDGDGAISRQEAQGDERLIAEWDQLDRNEDGKLDVSELSRLEE